MTPRYLLHPFNLTPEAMYGRNRGFKLCITRHTLRSTHGTFTLYRGSYMALGVHTWPLVSIHGPWGSYMAQEVIHGPRGSFMVLVVM